MALQPGQTPMMLLEAGNLNGFTLECAKALIRAGYDPGDFGTYNEVKGKIKKAKADCDAYDKWDPASGTPRPAEPTPSQRFLSQCQSGHLSQNAIFRQTNGRKSACANHQPEADCYMTNEAPCMPHHGRSCDAGSTHQQITVNEPEASRAPLPGVAKTDGDALNDKEITGAAGQTTDLALKAANEPKPTDPPDKLVKDGQANMAAARDLQEKRLGDDPAAKDKLEEERAIRKKGSSAMQQASAADLSGQGAAVGNDGLTQEQSNKLAADCIEDFRKRKMAEMRKKVMGENTTESKKAAQKKAAEAVDEAKTKKEAAKKAVEDKKKEAADHAKARDEAKAKKDEAKKKAEEADKKLKEHGEDKNDATARALRKEKKQAELDAKRAETAETRAEKKRDTAEKNIPVKEQKVATAEKQLAEAEDKKKEADRRLAPPPPPGGMTDEEQCLQTQADRLQQTVKDNGGTMPQPTGKVPPRGAELGEDDDAGEASSTDDV